MKKTGLFYIMILTFALGMAHSSLPIAKTIVNQLNDEITATITKSTSEEQFNDLISYFNDNGITLNLSEVNYNESNEIISIKISLEKDGQHSNYSLSSNQPISDIQLGLKDNSLFIKTIKGTHIQSSQNSLSDLFEQLNNSTLIDSLLTSSPFSFNLNSADMQELMNSNSFNFDFNNLNDFFNQFNNSNQAASINQSHSNKLPKYNFINTPGVQKLIVINGEESDFNTLNELAKNDQLEEVDNLKPATAISLYGNKAQDGAIIATTKK